MLRVPPALSALRAENAGRVALRVGGKDNLTRAILFIIYHLCVRN